MKVLIASLSAALLLSACGREPASEAPPTETAGTETMPAPMPGADATAAPPGPGTAPQQATSASASGTIQSIDAGSGKITIAHGPVPSIDWPAMTMGFKATPEQIASVKAGQKVRFEFQAQGMDATLTAIAVER